MYKIIQKINEMKNWFVEKTNKIDTQRNRKSILIKI